jgi:hypothetical protein
MTQFPHDQFAKDLLETLLSPFGEFQTAKTIDSKSAKLMSTSTLIPPLSETADTLWLRILGRDNVQIRAIAEITRLASDNPYRQNALELFSNLKIILENKQNRNREETESIMNLSPLYLEQIDIATQQGRAAGEATGISTGLERGRLEEGKSLIIRQLTRKLGELNSETIEQIARLNLDAIESLGDALLDFDRMEDLLTYLQSS